jgi:outer membrane receptor protein involved in Fe transport
MNHNAWVTYRFDRGSHRWLRGVSVRLGINNVFDVEPPLADETYGYAGGSANVRGRQATLELSRKF